MSPISREALMQQFRTTNYIGLAMIGSVFLYAGLVMGINHGLIPMKIRPTLNSDVSTNIKYILLGISVLHYFIIKFFQKISMKAANRLPAASIIVFALSEAVGIYGLVLFLLTGNANDFFIFMAISLFYFFIFYPKYAEWERLLTPELQANPSRR
jgi:F0F1-type ATP synthase membrane subunit c/vacuolar-type H+-ATPase subunit K